MKKGEIQPGRIYTAGKGVHGPSLLVTPDPLVWHEPDRRGEKRQLEVTPYILAYMPDDDEEWYREYNNEWTDWHRAEPRHLAKDVGAADELDAYVRSVVEAARERQREHKERHQNAEELRHILQEYIGATDDARGWGWGHRVEIPVDFHRPLIDALRR